jgi:hypothetical protein
MKICHVLRVYQQFSTKWYYFITAHRRRHLVLALTRCLGKSSEKFHASRSTSSCLTLHTAIFQTLPFRSFLQICPPSRFLSGPSWWYYLSGPPRGLSLVVLCGLWLAVPSGPPCGLPGRSLWSLAGRSFGPPCGFSLAVPRGLWLAVPRGLWLAVPRGLWLAVPRGLWLAVPRGLWLAVHRGLWLAVPRGPSLAVIHGPTLAVPCGFPPLSCSCLLPTSSLPLFLSVALPYCLVMLHMYTP